MIAWFGPAIIDDAYITFRYATNIAHGKGFVFNASEGPILGTSTPLFTLLLAVLELCGIAAPKGAMALSVIAAWGVLFFGMLLFQVELSRKYARMAGAAWGLILCGLLQWVFALQSGMETLLFMGLAMASIWACRAGRPFWCAALVGLMVLTRYDGWALALLLLAWNFRGDKKTALKALAVFALIQAPWVIFTLIEFGSYFPHSVLAKRVIHTRSLGENLGTFYEYFRGGILPSMIGIGFHRRLALLLILALVMIGIGRRPGPMLLLAWGLAMVAGFSLSGFTVFEWYLVPVLMACTWLAVWGVWAVAEEIPNIKILSNPIFLLCFFAVMAVPEWSTGLSVKKNIQVRVMKESAYLRTAQWVRQNTKPGAKALVGEVGALGWGLLDDEVIDSSGINSHAAYLARLRDHERLIAHGEKPLDEGSKAWVLNLIQETHPDMVIALDQHLHLRELRQDPLFTQNYRLVHQEPASKSWNIEVWERAK